MSHIEQALKRAGAAETGATAAARADRFSSPWPTVRETESAAAPAPVIPPSSQDPAAPAFGTPVAMVTFSPAWRDRLATSPNADPVLVEQFRRLGAMLLSAQTAGGVRVLMVTSASPEDGKTLTSLNLSLVLSESYRKRVLLIDADLRRPSLGKATELTAVPGLSDALKATIDQPLSLVAITPTLTLLPAGRPDHDPMGALTSPRMRHILEEAASRFDWVLLDAPPMGPLADARLLAEMADAAIFVIRAGRTRHAAVKKAIDILGRERLLGVVLNGVERLPADDVALYTADTKT